MKKYKHGTKFVVSSREELIKRGWTILKGGSVGKVHLYSEDFGESISVNVLKIHEGRTLTVDYESEIFSDWYWVQENCFRWPVGTFLETNFIHQCIEGMTPIDGWFICKTCGINLKEIK